MKRLIPILCIITLMSCKENKVKMSEPAVIADNEELKVLYQEDQADRLSGEIDWSVVSVRDSLRLARVCELVDSNLIRTSEDYANAAMVFQHGSDTFASGMAVKLMRKAVEMDSTRNKWLLAAAIDRDLMRRDVPQIYGTQYVKMGADNPWELYKIDTTKVTDEERLEYRVETLAQQRETVRRMNKKKISEFMAEGKSLEDLIGFIEAEDLKNSEYDLSESGINDFGYQLLGETKEAGALEIFKLNTELYPQGYNTWDSYGECLVKIGNTEEGIKAYKKSLELNPNNDFAIKVIKELEGE